MSLSDIQIYNNYTKLEFTNNKDWTDWLGTLSQAEQDILTGFTVDQLINLWASDDYSYTDEAGDHLIWEIMLDNDTRYLLTYTENSPIIYEVVGDPGLATLDTFKQFVLRLIQRFL